jgi:tetratricopeptide (TPR) repeat protein
MRSLFCLFLLCAAVLPAHADDGETMPERTLKQIVERQQALLKDAAQQGESLDAEGLRAQLQSVCHEYDLLLQNSPDFAAAYASYGFLLWKVDMRKQAVGLLLKANQLDPNIALVKNEIGNYLAEEDKPLEAVNYFLAAIKLEPKEPLYHFQLGTLLFEGRDEFIKSGDWTRESINDAMSHAFQQAAELAPDNIAYSWAYATSFYALPHPDWDQALKVWAALEDKAQSPIERQTMRLNAANVLIKQGKFDRARLLLDSVTEVALDQQKQKLVAQLAESPKN